MRDLRATFLVFIGFCAACFLSGPAVGETWRVEKDGTGDAMVIQDAVNKAASGDTILIGPGRFDDKIYATSIGWSDSVRALVTQDELTMIGSGPTTIIGQVAPWSSDQGSQKGIVVSDYWGNTKIHISGMRFENMRDGVYIAYEFSGNDSAEVHDCEFYRNQYSLYLIGDGGDIDIWDCDFSYMPGSGIHASGTHFGNVVISDCVFRLEVDSPLVSQSSVNFAWTDHCIIERCQFYEGEAGVTISFGGPSTIRNCLFDGQTYFGIAPGADAHVTVDSCTFRHQDDAIESGSGAVKIVLSNSNVEDTSGSSCLLEAVAEMYVRNCDLASGSRGAVYVTYSPNCTDPVHLDFRGNYWGTTDADSIASLIWDHNDSPDACQIIDYIPFRDTTTPVEKKSMGSIKGLFR